MEINIEPRPTTQCRELDQHSGFSGAGRPNRQHELVVGIRCPGQHVLDLRCERRGHRYAPLLLNRRLLDPMIEVAA